MNTSFLFCPYRIFIALALVLLVLWLVLDTSKRPEQLISFGGVCMFILLLFLFSAHRTAVSFAQFCQFTDSNQRWVIMWCFEMCVISIFLICFDETWGYQLVLCHLKFPQKCFLAITHILWRLIKTLIVKLLTFFLKSVLGVMEACVLGSGNAVLYWPFCYKNRAWTHSFPMAWRSSKGITIGYFIFVK